MSYSQSACLIPRLPLLHMTQVWVRGYHKLVDVVNVPIPSLCGLQNPPSFCPLLPKMMYFPTLIKPRPLDPQKTVRSKCEASLPTHLSPSSPSLPSLSAAAAVGARIWILWPSAHTEGRNWVDSIEERERSIVIAFQLPHKPWKISFVFLLLWKFKITVAFHPLLLHLIFNINYWAATLLIPMEGQQ